MRARGLLALLASLGAALAVAGTAAADGGKLVVDDDKAQCPNAQFTTIQAAVTAAQPGDEIRVCAGTYTATTVDKSLKLRGATEVGKDRRCLDRTTGENPATDAIVNGAAGAPGFRVVANDVRIRGFTVQNATNDAGISLSKAHSGYDVRENLIQENTFGVYLNSSGEKRSRVERNCFRDNNRPGSAAGNGVYSDQGVKRAEVEKNVFTGHENAAMIFVGPRDTQSGLKLNRNLLTDDGPVILAKVTRSEVSHNVSLKSKGSGIFFGGDVSHVRVKENVLRDGAFTGINLRTDSASYGTTGPNTDNVIEGNRVSGFGDAGIRLREGATKNVVRGNRLASNGTGADGDGISLENADNNLVRGNRSEANRRDGLRADAASSGNRIERNRMTGNREHDCHDDSTGTGTAGTANVWRGNRGATENRRGLCRPNGNGNDDDDHHDDDDDDDDDKGKGKGKGNG